RSGSAGEIEGGRDDGARTRQTHHPSRPRVRRRARGSTFWSTAELGREIRDVRAVVSTDVAAKAELLVESGRRRIVRAQADGVESAVGGLHGAFHQLPAHAHAAERGQD